MADDTRPLAIGGLGGSGTRIVAAIIREFGYYIGDDLNGANDNLWFTLLFKRRSVLLETDQDFAHLFSIFQARMTNGSQTAANLKDFIATFSAEDRIQHEKGWLAERAASFLNQASTWVPGQPWGWKEPNTHIVIDRILPLHPTLRYVHVVRSPFYMMNSGNQNQLQNWAPIFFNREVDVNVREIIAYWCCAHRRIESIQKLFPGRILFLSHDHLCADPDREVRRFADAMTMRLPEHVLEKAANLVARLPLTDKQPDLRGIASKADVDFIERFLDQFR